MDANSDPIRLGEGAEAPILTGNTLEEKVSGAQSLIGKLFTQAQSLFQEVGRLTNEMAETITDRDRLQGLFDTATGEVTAAKADVTRLTSELSTMTSARDAEKTRAEKSEGHVGNLEKLCGVKGIDPRAALKVPAEGSTQNTPNALKEEFGHIKAQEDKGEVPKGTASKFYRSNKKALDAA